ncbi:glutaredoxin family protein [Aliiglaciecola sp. LCG003]|uniref:glutaredoxin family protein n=1 Tax=Aliiglaciecola sp. LCG003 TaxID=3053655 RepID=UPI0025730062|nr:glutaredoxin family protein [Aliiglaciecola sp. LCG003]WJG07647.1 glutaredoxin family protein [Aliiglaciecola sp. LCG003]
MQLQFFSGQQCHLCDLAQQLLDQHPRNQSIEIIKLDVKSDPALYHLYGARIPVLKRQDNQQELAWPFDADLLSEFLN